MFSLVKNQHLLLAICFLLTISLGSHLAFDDELDQSDHHASEAHHPQGKLPKDKILLKDVGKLVFLRNKRTTSRRTHSIHQLSCVGGTAGCKLFTPDTVECAKGGYSTEKGKFDWKCHAEISDRVQFNHVEVICEGYDYPEDDYILLGSCGLEFTLDYTDPHDYHSNSYFKHMDDHEKEMHHERVRSKQQKPPTDRFYGFSALLKSLTIHVKEHMFVIGCFLFLALCSIIIVRTFTTNNTAGGKSGKSGKQTSRVSSYGPLTSAVLTTKKAC